tara:strand:- start:904 stop:1083 length:180 start_codon:yes stop_codon:yes gene_type:complete
MQLYDRMTAVRFDSVGETSETRQVEIAMRAKLTWEPDSPMLHRGSAGHGESKTPLSSAG